MQQKPHLELVSGAEAAEQLQKFPAPVQTGLFHIPNQLTWPLLVPHGGLKVTLEPGNTEKQLTYGLVSAIVAFEDNFYLLGHVDYAYGDVEHTAVFRLDWTQDRTLIESIAELGIIGLTDQMPPKLSGKEEMVEHLTRVATFVCQFDAMELHRLKIQMIRMQEQAKITRH
ncbi:hypothetical protein CIG75_16325 [Tumebacillus algifaecis]|uniref:Uncharacterized protein n=1 Tax=Tumebacillus algifaecis TaxID=1214604 RepID=A0A223D427_9BACL|nr:hypothetical protein [Tumebacillus algifaecis]ASS76362.1 hypothetical protein CIG75_16325 [Tumebacillus algifaecis]